jgi:hypothetical protein
MVNDHFYTCLPLLFMAALGLRLLNPPHLSSPLKLPLCHLQDGPESIILIAALKVFQVELKFTQQIMRDSLQISSIGQSDKRIF